MYTYTVCLRVSQCAYAENTNQNFFTKRDVYKRQVVVDYHELSQHSSEKGTLHLRTFPTEVRQARLEIKEVDYLIEQQ